MAASKEGQRRRVRWPPPPSGAFGVQLPSQTWQPEPAATATQKQVSMHRGPVDEGHQERRGDALSEDRASHVDALHRWVTKYAHAGLEGSRLLSIIDRGSKRHLPPDP